MNLFVSPSILKKTTPIYGKLHEYASLHYGLNHELKAWEAFSGEGGLSEYPPSELIMEVFFPWYIYSWSLPEENSIGFEYLIKHYSKLDEIEKIFLGSSLKECFSFYQIKKIGPGHYIEMSNVLTREKTVVFENLASQVLRPGQIIFAKIVSVYDLNFIASCSSIVLPNHYLDEIKSSPWRPFFKKSELGRIAFWFGITASFISSDAEN